MLRPSSVSNGAALVKRFGVVAVNSALEVEFLGKINSNYIDEMHVISGIGRAKDFRPKRVGDSRGPVIERTWPKALMSRADGPHADHTEYDTTWSSLNKGLLTSVGTRLDTGPLTVELRYGDSSGQYLLMILLFQCKE